MTPLSEMPGVNPQLVQVFLVQAYQFRLFLRGQSREGFLLRFGNGKDLFLDKSISLFRQNQMQVSSLSGTKLKEALLFQLANGRMGGLLAEKTTIADILL